MRKLEIGAGKSRLEGFETSDIMPGCDYQCSATEISKLGKFDHLYANMILEHLRPWEVPVALKDWYEALNDGGILDVIVPDFDDIMKLTEKNLPEALHRLFGGSLEEGGFNDCPEQEHRWAFTAESLFIYLEKAGFYKKKRMPSAVGILYFRAVK
jgi:predicted SAM-dependent methyltransferase